MMFLRIFSHYFKRINLSHLPFHLFSTFFLVVPFLIVLAKAITPSHDQPLSENLAFVNPSLWTSLARSIFVAGVTLVLVLLLGYPFAYWTNNIQSKFWRMLVIALITCPLWSSFFVKLIGLKSFFDLLYGEMNSTRGLLYVIIGLVYLNLPMGILTIYNSVSCIPRNIINASLDLGRTNMETILRVVFPYTRKAIVSVIYLVFLPSVTCVTVADFMNKSNDSKLISQFINDLIGSGGTEGIGVHRLSFLTLFLISLIFVCYFSFKCLKKLTIRLYGYAND